MPSSGRPGPGSPSELLCLDLFVDADDIELVQVENIDPRVARARADDVDHSVYRLEHLVDVVPDAAGERHSCGVSLGRQRLRIELNGRGRDRSLHVGHKVPFVCEMTIGP